MLPSEVTIEVRDAGLARVGQVPRKLWTDVKAIMRLYRVGEWSMTLPRELAICDALRQPGAGIIITGPEGVILSGVMEEAKRKQSKDDPIGSMRFSGVDDNFLLDDYRAYPDPAHAATAQAAAYDTRTGPGESVIRAYINANIGPGALAARRLGMHAENLVMLADEARGSVVTGNARFDIIGELIEPLAKVSGVAYRIVQSGSTLVPEFWEPADKSKIIRLDVANGRLSQTEFTLGVPLLTDVLVLGQGEGADRQVVERTSVLASAAREAWRRRREVVKDQRNTDVVAELEQAGDELLVDGGKTRTTNAITPTDSHTMRFQRDWNLGDVVGVVVGDDEVPETVTAVGLAITKDGIAIGAKVGEQ